MSLVENKKLDKKKRERAVNFTPREQTLLFSIALKKKHILENKKTNAATNTEKSEAWMQITSEFNATSPDFNNRSTEQLKRFYENRRMLAKKKKAEARQHIFKTGGGPPSPKNEEDELVLATMDPLTFEGHQNRFDSDNITPIIIRNNPGDIELIYEQPEREPEENLESDDNYLENNNLESIDNMEESILSDNETEEKTNWKKYNSNDLKRKINPFLCRPEKPKQNIVKDRNRPVKAKDRRRPTATVVRSLASNALAQKYHELADKKNIIADHAIQKIEKERMNSEEEHQLKIKNLELDILIKKKQLQKL